MKHFFSTFRSFLICLITALSAAGANGQVLQMEIHHINVENGDATMVVVRNMTNNTFVFKMLIDGGNSSTPTFLQPYLQNYFGALPVNFDYLVLSHFHADHYRGLLGVSDGSVFTADSVIDPGGYDLGTGYPTLQPAETNVDRGALGTKCPQWKNAIKDAYDHDDMMTGRRSILARSVYFSGFPSSLGRWRTVATVGGTAVTLTCIAGAGYSIGAGPAVVNNASAFPTRMNPNNFCLGFLITCGQFRYFTGGDMGGYSADGCGNYIDQETTLTHALVAAYSAASYPYSSDTANVLNNAPVNAGHICAMKMSHHGSDCSTNLTWAGARPCLFITSAGGNARWKLPSAGFLGRLNTNYTAIAPGGALTQWKPGYLFAHAGLSNTGVYFTNLYDFGTANPAHQTATNNFGGRVGVNFSYGNNYPYTTSSGACQSCSPYAADKDSYVITVNSSWCNLAVESAFNLRRVNYSKTPQVNQVLTAFQCHSTTVR